MLRPILFDRGSKYAIVYAVVVPTMFYTVLSTVAFPVWIFFSIVMPFVPTLAVIAITLAQTYLISLIKSFLAT